MALTDAPSAADIALPPWLEAEPETATVLRALVVALAAAHPTVAAIVLYGSMARGEARPLDDPNDPDPSDVDLLALVYPPQVPDRQEQQKAQEQIPEDVQHMLWQAEWGVVFADARRAGVTAGAKEDARDAGNAGNTGVEERDVRVLASPWNLAPHWDTLFVETVAEDGLLLWARPAYHPLPAALAAVAARAGLLRVPRDVDGPAPAAPPVSD